MSDVFTQADMTALREDIGELKASIKEFTRAVDRLTRLEVKHDGAQNDLDRAHADISELRAKVAALELAASSRKSSNALLDKGIYAALGVLAAFVAKKLGLL